MFCDCCERIFLEALYISKINIALRYSVDLKASKQQEQRIRVSFQKIFSASLSVSLFLSAARFVRLQIRA